MFFWISTFLCHLTLSKTLLNNVLHLALTCEHCLSLSPPSLQHTHSLTHMCALLVSMIEVVEMIVSMAGELFPACLQPSHL